MNALTEVSSVRTDPALRGSGYGLALVAFLAAQTLGENIAKVLYTKVGFSVRRAICLKVIARRPDE